MTLVASSPAVLVATPASAVLIVFNVPVTVAASESRVCRTAVALLPPGLLAMLAKSDHTVDSWLPRPLVLGSGNTVSIDCSWVAVVSALAPSACTLRSRASSTGSVSRSVPETRTPASCPRPV